MAVRIKNVTVAFDGDEAEAREVVGKFVNVLEFSLEEFTMDVRVRHVIEDFIAELRAANGRPAEDEDGEGEDGAGATVRARRPEGAVPRRSRAENRDQQSPPAPAPPHPAPVDGPPDPPPAAEERDVPFTPSEALPPRETRPRFGGNGRTANPYRIGGSAPVPQDPVPSYGPKYRSKAELEGKTA